MDSPPCPIVVSAAVCVGHASPPCSAWEARLASHPREPLSAYLVSYVCRTCCHGALSRLRGSPSRRPTRSLSEMISIVAVNPGATAELFGTGGSRVYCMVVGLCPQKHKTARSHSASPQTSPVTQHPRQLHMPLSHVNVQRTCNSKAPGIRRADCSLEGRRCESP